MTAATPVSPVPVAPSGLTRRAERFVACEGVRVARHDIECHRDAWIEHGVPAAEIDRAVAFEDRWGGLALPPAPFYESGPRVLGADVPEGSATDGWWIPAGDGRYSMAYGFMIGPEGEFGISGYHWTPLHASTEGWVESLALADHARRRAKTITRITGKAVDSLDLEGYEPVPEVRGLTDSWWRGKDSLVALYRGEAVGTNAPRCLEAHVYAGLDERALQGD
ncbi:hypothetical protein J3A78_000288 [Streptomyces sp. PvR006]|uniref:hypothetical protein n=1 Tax=Streptomyces sp. PvR006 TaxID=2817860 RepID=UPI001AE52786|nr:hypothetical protein [Streptomyces sp. PvR006]MBP2579810.1 hypothetical protein [Streptomyces sp. PvR006]